VTADATRPPRAVPTVGDLGERGVIDRVRARLPAPPAAVLLGIGDDAAVVAPDRNRADVVTTDALVEHVHFERRYVPPGAIGHKALAVNLSDLAAMGARPRVALLSLVLPPSWPVADLDALAGGFAALAARHRVALVGGNVARSPGPLVVDVAAVGSVHRRRALTRSAARPGDAIYVSGSVGGAAAGLAWLASGAGRAGPDVPGDIRPALDACAERFLRPEPRVRLGLALGGTRSASAAIDLSDGLADALRQVAEASGLGAVIEGAAVPVDPGARWWFERHGADPLDAALAGGEDYELLATVPARRARAFAAAAARAGVRVSRIGVMTAARRVVVARGGREEELPAGFAHFR
jgi:thiamine-monophosphate kinase